MKIDQHLLQQIIEAATLALKLGQLNEQDEELEQLDRAFQAALSRLAPENHGAMMMVRTLLDGKPYGVTCCDPDSIRLYIALAYKIGATVEDSDSVLGARGRSIMVYPPTQAKQ